MAASAESIRTMATNVQATLDAFITMNLALHNDASRSSDWIAEQDAKMRTRFKASVTDIGREAIAAAEKTRTAVRAATTTALDALDQATNWSKVSLLTTEYSGKVNALVDNPIAGKYRSQMIRAEYEQIASRHEHARAFRAAARPLLAKMSMGDLADVNTTVSLDLLNRFAADEMIPEAQECARQLAQIEAALAEVSSAIWRAEQACDPDGGRAALRGQGWWHVLTGAHQQFLCGVNVPGVSPDGVPVG